jgi:hypothetical protein
LRRTWGKWIQLYGHASSCRQRWIQLRRSSRKHVSQIGDTVILKPVCDQYIYHHGKSIVKLGIITRYHKYPISQCMAYLLK